jgi:hypothetical protein
MADPLPHRPEFLLPFPKGTTIHLQTYRGHNPDDKKVDMYREGMKIGSDILASAAGLVHEHFDPGGIEINHGNGWFTTYMHMSNRIAVNTQVRRGDWVGTMGSVGVDYPHLHHEQLFVQGGGSDADNTNIVNPLIQGRGPIIMDPDNPIIMVSTNTAAAGHVTAADVGHGGGVPIKFFVDTFADAPVFASLTDTHPTGTLKKGTNYVFGKHLGRVTKVGPNFNHFWMKTDPDIGTGVWASAYYLSRWGNDEAKDNNGRVLPDV